MDEDSEIVFDDNSQEDETDVHVTETSFSGIVTWGVDWTVDSILSQLKRNTFNLNPKFQRRNAWGPDKKSKLIESIILGLPVPEIVLAESNDEQKEFTVIDGKQRLLTIQQFCGIENEDNTEYDSDANNFKLQKLDIIDKLNGKTYSDLISDPELRKYRLRFENSTVRTIVIKNWPNEDVLYKIFHRLNTGSVQLSPQELRQALHPGKFLEYANDYSQKSVGIKKMMKLKKPDPRMRDVELFIRYFAFRNYLEYYKGNLKEFMDLTSHSLNLQYSSCKDSIENQVLEFEEAIRTTYAIFEEDAFHKWSNGKYASIFNRAVFDIMVYYFSYPEIRDSAMKEINEVEAKFRSLCKTDADFLKALEGSTKDKSSVHKRFSTWEKALSSILDIDVEGIASDSSYKIELVLK